MQLNNNRLSIATIDNELDKVRRKVVNRIFNETDSVNNSELFVKYFVYAKLYKNHFAILELTNMLDSIVSHLTTKKQKLLYKTKTGISFPTTNFKMFRKKYLNAANIPEHIIRELLLVPKYTYLINKLKQESDELAGLLSVERKELNKLNNSFMTELALFLEKFKRVPLGPLFGSLSIRSTILKPRSVASHIETAKTHKEALEAFRQLNSSVTIQDLISEYGLEPTITNFPAIKWNYVCWNKPQTELARKKLRYHGFKQSRSDSSLYKLINKHLYER